MEPKGRYKNMQSVPGFKLCDWPPAPRQFRAEPVAVPAAPYQRRHFQMHELQRLLGEGVAGAGGRRRKTCNEGCLARRAGLKRVIHTLGDDIPSVTSLACPGLEDWSTPISDEESLRLTLFDKEVFRSRERSKADRDRKIFFSRAGGSFPVACSNCITMMMMMTLITQGGEGRGKTNKKRIKNKAAHDRDSRSRHHTDAGLFAGWQRPPTRCAIHEHTGHTKKFVGRERLVEIVNLKS